MGGAVGLHPEPPAGVLLALALHPLHAAVHLPAAPQLHTVLPLPAGADTVQTAAHLHTLGLPLGQEPLKVTVGLNGEDIGTSITR